jgi:alpha-mannosidase
LNQFHDILPGSSIHRVYEEAEVSYAEVMETANNVSEAAAERLLESQEGMTVFNSLSWERSVLVALPEGFAGARDAQDQALPVQAVGDQTWVEVSTPASGWTTLAAGEGAAIENTLIASDTLLENAYLRAEFNQKGEIVRLLDKESGRELAAGACNSFKMYKDVPTMWDAWDLDSMYEQTPVELDNDAEIEVVAEGPLFAKLRIRRMLNQSELVQEVVLRRDSCRLDFHTVIDWQESHKLLKVNFPVTIQANEAIHEIQFGHLRRPNHFSRQFDADRFEVSNHKWTALAEEKRGCAVLNDSKYGINVLANSINLTLLKSALAPDMTADKGRQEFSYAFYAWNGAFGDSGLVQQGYDLNCPPMFAEGAAGETSLLSLDVENVIIEAVKPAEDGSGDIVVRLYESMRTATRCQLTVNLPVKGIHETDMLENVQAEMPFESGQIALDFQPFEIKTLRLQL